MKKVNKAITIITIIISAFVLYALISPYLKQTVIESIDGYCLTIRGKYIIPYKYTKIMPPQEDFIKYEKNIPHGYEIGYIDKTHLIIYEVKGVSELNMPHIQYIIDSSYSLIDTMFQTRFTVCPIDDLFHPQICIHRESIDTCYIHGRPWAKLRPVAADVPSVAADL